VKPLLTTRASFHIVFGHDPTVHPFYYKQVLVSFWARAHSPFTFTVRAQKPVFTSAATQKPVLCYNLIGQKPVNPLLTPHALFQRDCASHPCPNSQAKETCFMSAVFFYGEESWIFYMELVKYNYNVMYMYPAKREF